MQHLAVVITFPDKPGIEKNGILHLDDDNNHWIEFPAYGYQFFEDQFPVIYASYERYDDLYTCIQCIPKSMDAVTCSLYITELILGEYSPAANIDYYYGIVAEINGLNEWVAKDSFSFSIAENMKAIVKSLPSETKSFAICEDAALSLDTWCLIHTAPHVASLETRSCIHIDVNNAGKRLDLYNHVLNFIRIQSLFLHRPQTLAKLQLRDDTTEYKELQRKDIKQIDQKGSNVLLSFVDIEPFFGTILSICYSNIRQWSRVIDLLNEGRRNKTVEISFLNITTGLEVFHKYFIENDDKEIAKRINTLLFSENVTQSVNSKWVNVTRYYHLLEMASSQSFFQQRVENKIDFCRRMRNTRNWLTHFDESIETIWSPAKLVVINQLLIGLLKAVVLQKLEMPELLIHKLLFADDEIFFHDYETNPFALTYREESFGSSRTT